MDRRRPLGFLVCFTAASLFGGACTDCDGSSPPLPPGAIEPDIYCPGGPSCPLSDDDSLHVGAAVRDVTPPGYEIAKVSFLTDRNQRDCLPEMEQLFGLRRCGSLHYNFKRDCGNDQICPDNIGGNLETGDQATDGIDNDDDGLLDGEDVAYVGRDDDGSEGDGVLDFFLDCGLDRLCPDNVPETGPEAADGIDNDGDGAVDSEDIDYPGPDEGEGDGEFQGLWIAGYGTNRPGVGIHDPLWIRAMVFASGETSVAIVALDTVGFFYDEVLRLRQAVQERLRGTGVDVDYVLLSTTHTHEAPDTVGQWGMADPSVSEDVSDETGRLPGYNAYIVEQATDAVVEAATQLRPARLNIAATRTGTDHFIHDGEDPVIIDDRMLVVHAVDRDSGDTIGTLVNWSNHPESLDSDNNFVSSDYADALRRTVEEGLPAGVGPALPGLGGVCVYHQGMVGGLLGPNGFDIVGYDGTEYPYRDAEGNHNVKTFARTEALGQNIGAVALHALDDAETVERGKITVRAKAFKIPVDNVLFHFGFVRELFDRELYDWDMSMGIGEDNRPHLRTEAAIIEIGPIAFLTVPGEGFPELAVGGYDGSWTPGGADQLVSSSNPNPPDVSTAPPGPYFFDLVDAPYEFMIGLANDEIGYLVPPWRFELAASPWIEEAPGDHYCETNSVGIEAVPTIEENLRGISLFPLFD